MLRAVVVGVSVVRLAEGMQAVGSLERSCGAVMLHLVAALADLACPASVRGSCSSRRG
jgi:hypothetical protein